MKEQAKKLAHKLLVGGLCSSLLGCGVTSEMASHPSTSSVGLSQAASASEPDRAGAARPIRSSETSRLTGASATVRLAASPATSAVKAPAANAEPELVAIGSPNRRIQSGRIVDEAGEPLVGATVLLKGTTRGASTDENGGYSLAVPTGTNTFVFGYSGYQEETAQSRDGQPLTVTLLPLPDQEPLPSSEAKPNKPRFVKLQTIKHH